jgi:hypothetical protein
MLPARADIERLNASDDRRPYFCAEALTRRFRLGLLMLTIVTELFLFVLVAKLAITPDGLSGLGGALLVGALFALTFVVLLFFGALAGNNPRLSTGARISWYTAFLLAGPVAIPYYWRVHVWPTPFAGPSH